MFISIRWKALSFLSLVLISLTTIWILQTVFNSINDHEQALLNQRQHQQTTLAQIFQDRFLQLSSSAQLIIEQQDIVQLLDAHKPTETSQIDLNGLDDLWLNLSINIASDYLSIKDESFNTYLSRYNQETLSNTHDLEKVLENQLAMTQSSGPAQFIFCDSGCMQVVIEPVLLDDGKTFYVSIGQNLSYMTELFATYTSDSLGILFPVKKADQKAASNLIENWNTSIWALGNFEHSFHVLRQFSEVMGFDFDTADSEYDGRHYQLNKMTHNDLAFHGLKPVLITLSDVTASWRQLNMTIIKAVITGLIALILTELLLIYIVSGPIKSLLGINQSLQLLPQKAYKMAKQQLVKKEGLIGDEISTLERSAEFVIDALHDNDIQIEEKKQQLEEKLSELSRSQSFLTRLIDNSQLFILTQDFELRVETRNQLINTILTKDSNSYLDCCSANDELVIKHAIDQLKNGQRSVTYHEGHSFNLDNHEGLFIAWTHTVIEDQSGQLKVLSIGTDLTQRKEAERALTWMAHHDALTGISNRRGFQDRLEEMSRTEEVFSLIFIDINRFKQINDIYGHKAGDEVLKEVARQLKEHSRETDHISRLAGDEFTILLSRTDDKELDHVLEKFTDVLQGQVLIDEDRVVEYSTSLGGAAYPQHTEDTDELVIYADMAMYQAKREGESRWHKFNENDEHLAAFRNEFYFSSLIKTALAEDKFELVYQPISSIMANKVGHYEVLLRMLDNIGEYVFPGDFIPIAEKTGLIRSIDAWVLENALQTLEQLNKDSIKVSFSINVSAPTLQSQDFPKQVNTLLGKYQVEAKQVIIELTETSYIENFANVLSNLNELNAIGIKVALDDFGVGFSSFNYLKKLPLSYVKLDGSYIRKLCENHDDQVFVKSVTEMVEAYGMKTIAEFVENDETYQLLGKLGVHYAQGYHIGKPQKLENYLP